MLTTIVLSIALGAKTALGEYSGPQYVPVDCGSHTCDDTLEYVHGHATNITVTKTCAGEGWFYKGKGRIMDGTTDGVTLNQFCRNKGFDGMGLAAISVPYNEGGNRRFNQGEEVNVCNNKYAYKKFMSDETAYYWNIAFECIDFPTGPAECCDTENKWTWKCYNRRGPWNKWAGCMQCGGLGYECGPCEEACNQSGDFTYGAKGVFGHNSPHSYQCKQCCHDAVFQFAEGNDASDWQCGEAMTREQAEAMCAATTGDFYNGFRKAACKNALKKEVGRCSYTKGTNTCELRVFYPKCDELKPRHCKKAVRKGRCEYDSKKDRTCRMAT